MVYYFILLAMTITLKRLVFYLEKGVREDRVYLECGKHDDT